VVQKVLAVLLVCIGARCPFKNEPLLALTRQQRYILIRQREPEAP
jgi:hypothetical protein